MPTPQGDITNSGIWKQEVENNPPQCQNWDDHQWHCDSKKHWNGCECTVCGYMYDWKIEGK